MMMTKIRKPLLFLTLFCLGICVYSQSDDFGLWYGISAEHKLVKKLELDLSACVRTFENASKIDEAFLEAGLTYKFNKYLAVGGSYRLTNCIEDNDTYHIRHKWFLDLRGSLPAGDFNFSARARFQERYKTYFEDENDKTPVSHFRGRLKVQYDIPSFPVNPYVATEYFFPVTSNADTKIDKKRYMLGAEYNIFKKHTIELEYIFQRDYHPNLTDINIISLNYNIKF